MAIYWEIIDHNESIVLNFQLANYIFFYQRVCNICLCIVSWPFGVIESFENMIKDTTALLRNTQIHVKLSSVLKVEDYLCLLRTLTVEGKNRNKDDTKEPNTKAIISATRD